MTYQGWYGRSRVVGTHPPIGIAVALWVRAPHALNEDDRHLDLAQALLRDAAELLPRATLASHRRSVHTGAADDETGVAHVHVVGKVDERVADAPVVGPLDGLAVHLLERVQPTLAQLLCRPREVRIDPCE